MTTAIKVEGLGKRYQIGAREMPYRTLRESLNRAVTSPWRRIRHKLQPEPRDFWALQDVNFEIRPGEVVGVIGRNGAGKSTLLKILSRITEPTTGFAEIHGHCSSLLEVGTGFHPELTGRENIYLNGAVLGMRRKEIERKFDAIIEFAGVQKFVDTAIKHYSSGMYLRLAFAVAAHLESEILLVDEVLAVGDVAFQKKCLGAMNAVAKAGRTVLLVSHNMAVIQSLCNQCILLEGGCCSTIGDARNVVDRYLRFAEHDSVPILKKCYRTGTGTVQLRSVVVTEDGTSFAPLSGAPVRIRMALENTTSTTINNVDVGFSVHDRSEAGLAMMFSSLLGKTFKLPPGESTISFVMDSPLLASGQYFLGFHIRQLPAEDLDFPQTLVPFDVVESDYYGAGKTIWRDWGALVLMTGKWQKG